MSINSQPQEAAGRLDNYMIESKALIKQALAYLSLGELDEAEKMLQRAYRYAQASESLELVGDALLHLARLKSYRSHLFDGLRFLNESRDKFTLSNIFLKQAACDYCEAELYEQLGMLKEAQQAAVRAANAFKERRPNDSMEARLLAVRLALRRGRTRQATTYLQQADLLLPKTANSFQNMYKVYQAHPLLQKSTEERQTALIQADEAVAQLEQISAVKEQLEASLIAAALAGALQRPDVEERYQQIITLAQHGFLSLEQEAYEALSVYQPPALAIQTLQRAVDVAGKIRQEMPLEELKATLLTGQGTLFGRLIEACLQSQQPLLACQVLLEAKGASWAELGRASQPVPPDSAWVRAKMELAFWQEQSYTAEADSSYQRELYFRIYIIEEIIQKLARRQARSRRPQSLPDISVVQGTLANSSLAIEYLVSQSHIWACVLHANHAPQWVKVARKSRVARLLRRLNPLRGDLSKRPSKERFMAAQARKATIDRLFTTLYDQLLRPLLSFLPADGELLIAPHDFLFEVPWAALRHQNRYLIEQYELSLLPSIALAAIPDEETTTKANREKGNVLPLALGYAGGPSSFGTYLPHIEAELQAIQQALPTFRCVYPAHLADMPTHEAPRYLHIAAHGQINRQSPLFSSIQLADQPLLLAEILNLSLQGTELVTLSACKIGMTPERGGIALALAGAFLTAGAQSVLASLWRLDDEATSILMSQLYHHLAQNKPLSQALAHAQRHLIAQGFQHPYYWAGFQLLSRKLA